MGTSPSPRIRSNSRRSKRAPSTAARVTPPRRQGVAGALFTSTQQRVLGLLYGQPDREFYASELFRLARGGRGAVQRELQKLVSSGLVTTGIAGRQKHYRANREAPIFEELRGIVVKTIGAADPVREALRPLAPRIARALVFGSIAKGTDRARSDIDLLVVADDLTLEDLFAALAPAEAVLDRRVSPTLIRRQEYEKARRTPDSFVDRALRGPTIPLLGDAA
jgi:predicted nucleotidyltransferase